LELSTQRNELGVKDPIACANVGSLVLSALVV
jgi:hypothetical protein